MTQKRFNKLLRAMFTEHHLKYGNPNISKAYRCCETRRKNLKAIPGANYQAAYEAIRNALLP